MVKTVRWSNNKQKKTATVLMFSPRSQPVFQPVQPQLVCVVDCCSSNKEGRYRFHSFLEVVRKSLLSVPVFEKAAISVVKPKELLDFLTVPDLSTDAQERQKRNAQPNQRLMGSDMYGNSLQKFVSYDAFFVCSPGTEALPWSSSWTLITTLVHRCLISGSWLFGDELVMRAFWHLAFVGGKKIQISEVMTSQTPGNPRPITKIPNKDISVLQSEGIILDEDLGEAYQIRISGASYVSGEDDNIANSFKLETNASMINDTSAIIVGDESLFERSGADVPASVLSATPKRNADGSMTSRFAESPIRIPLTARPKQFKVPYMVRVFNVGIKRSLSTLEPEDSDHHGGSITERRSSDDAHGSKAAGKPTPRIHRNSSGDAFMVSESLEDYMMGIRTDPVIKIRRTKHSHRHYAFAELTQAHFYVNHRPSEWHLCPESMLPHSWIALDKMSVLAESERGAEMVCCMGVLAVNFDITPVHFVETIVTRFLMEAGEKRMMAPSHLDGNVSACAPSLTYKLKTHVADVMEWAPTPQNCHFPRGRRASSMVTVSTPSSHSRQHQHHNSSSGVEVAGSGTASGSRDETYFENAAKIPEMKSRYKTKKDGSSSGGEGGQGVTHHEATTDGWNEEYASKEVPLHLEVPLTFVAAQRAATMNAKKKQFRKFGRPGNVPPLQLPKPKVHVFSGKEKPVDVQSARACLEWISRRPYFGERMGSLPPQKKGKNSVNVSFMIEYDGRDEEEENAKMKKELEKISKMARQKSRQSLFLSSSKSTQQLLSPSSDGNNSDRDNNGNSSVLPVIDSEIVDVLQWEQLKVEERWQRDKESSRKALEKEKKEGSIIVIHGKPKRNAFCNIAKHRSYDLSRTALTERGFNLTADPYKSQESLRRTIELQSKQKWVGGEFKVPTMEKSIDNTQEFIHTPYHGRPHTFRPVDPQKWIVSRGFVSAVPHEYSIADQSTTSLQ